MSYILQLPASGIQWLDFSVRFDPQAIAERHSARIGYRKNIAFGGIGGIEKICVLAFADRIDRRRYEVLDVSLITKGWRP